jgi:hypothetical protein
VETWRCAIQFPCSAAAEKSNIACELELSRAVARAVR